MASLWFYIIAVLVGFIIGYIVKDILTVERKIEVNVKKQKIKGDGSSIDADFDIDIQEKKKRFFNRKKEK